MMLSTFFLVNCNCSLLQSDNKEIFIVIFCICVSKVSAQKLLHCILISFKDFLELSPVRTIQVQTQTERFIHSFLRTPISKGRTYIGLVDNIFVFFIFVLLCFAICDLEHDIEAILPSLAANRIWKSFLKCE